MKIGIISFAHMHALSYAENIVNHAHGELTAIWDNDPDRGSKMSKQFNCNYYSDLDTFLQSDIEAVIICSENANHKEHVMKAAKAKKHILCEKPIATEIGDAKEMIDVCNEENVLLQVAYPVRYSPVIKQLKKIVASGKIGDVVAINGTNHGQLPGGWFVEKELSGGGAATDHVVHVMDIIRWILSDEVKDVYAELDTRFYDIDVEDCGIVTLEMESGVIVTIDPSWSRPKTFPTWGDVTMEVTGTKGSISIDALKQHTLFYNDAKNAVQHVPWAADTDQLLVDDFIKCVTEGNQPFTTGEDGLRTLEVVKGAYQSAEANEKIILDKLELT